MTFAPRGTPLAGLGTALPPHALSLEEGIELTAQLTGDDPARRRWIQRLYRGTTVRGRKTALLERDATGGPGDVLARQSLYHANRGPGDGGPGTAERMTRYAAAVGPLADAAARAALADAGLAADAVTHLVTVSCSGFAAPGFDCGLIESLGLPRGTARTHVGFMGCHGALNGLRVARGYCGAEPRAAVLVVAAELCSLHHQYDWDPGQVVASGLFGDGAAAAVLCGDDVMGGNGVRTGPGLEEGPDPWRLAANGSCLLPDSAGEMTWTVGDHGFRMTLTPRVPDLIREHLRPWCARWLDTLGLTIDGVGTWAVHPGGPKILTAATEALGLPASAADASRELLADVGNLSSPTILFLLGRLRAANAPRPCVALGFGPGLAIEAALFS